MLELIASGLSNQAIAAKLGLSTNTISNHISSIFKSKWEAERRRSYAPGQQASATNAVWRAAGG